MNLTELRAFNPASRNPEDYRCPVCGCSKAGYDDAPNTRLDSCDPETCLCHAEDAETIVYRGSRGPVTIVGRLRAVGSSWEATEGDGSRHLIMSNDLIEPNRTRRTT